MGWGSNKPIAELPERVRYLFVEEAELLLQELRLNRLCVELIPAPDPRYCGHKIRAVVNRNPAWYREIYHTTPHFRRDLSLSSLRRLSALKDQQVTSRSKYARYRYDRIYRSLILERLTVGYMTEEGERIPPLRIRNRRHGETLEEALGA